MNERVCGCGDVMFLPWEKDRCERCMPSDALPRGAKAYRMMHAELLRLSGALPRDEAAALQTEAERLRAVLREVEWEGMQIGRVCCPVCGGLPPLPPGCAREYVLKDDVVGHLPDCALAVLFSPKPAPSGDLYRDNGEGWRRDQGSDG